MVNYLLYRLSQVIALNLPEKIGYKIAAFFSSVYYIFAFSDRKIVKENLRAIFPQKTDQEIRRIRLRVFKNFAKYLVNFFRFQELDGRYIKKNVRIENRCFLDQALSKGRGVVILSAHLGNWELGGAVLANMGYPFYVVALPHKNKKVDNFFNYQRESKGMKVVPLGKAARVCLNALKENKIVGLVGDRAFIEKDIIIDFFGRPAYFPKGPAAFALKTGAAIVPAFTLRNEDDSFTLRIERPLEFNFSDKENDNLAWVIKKYKIIFEDYIRRYPDQWCMFRRFWIA
ncbi:MAG: lysophospholipid acyltransferase family protein [Candidatus Omnitrophota bacterium]|nr:lysophospholipid acyltransferase family protein [Candidatus Omnitrophota bacterium]